MDFGLTGVFVHYVGRMFATRFLGLLIFFIVILQMLDLLNNSADIYAAPGADWRSIVGYIAYRSPQIASQFTPFAALLAVVATLAALNQRSEITIMRSAGLSGQRVLQPIGVVCVLVALIHFGFQEAVVVPATEKLAYWEANAYAVDLPPQTETRSDVSFANGDEFITAASAGRENGRTHLDDVVIYRLSADGLAESIDKADHAIYSAGGWMLENVRMLSVGANTAQYADRTPWATTLDPAILFAVTLQADRTPIGSLFTQVGELKRSGASVANEMTSLLSRFSKPLSTLLMPLLGAIAGYGVTRAGTQLLRAATGATIGFTYFVAENLLIALGKLGAVPPVIGAFFPFTLFLVVGLAILVTMDN